MTSDLEIRIIHGSFYFRWNIGCIHGGEHHNTALNVVQVAKKFVETHAGNIHFDTCVKVTDNTVGGKVTSLQLFDDAEEIAFVLKYS
jgi:hypothetical protein